MASSANLPIAVYYEHPGWFRPLFDELERRGLPYVRLAAGESSFDPAEKTPPYSLVFNRMSPSAFQRGNGDALSYTLQYLNHLEGLGVRVVNGYDGYRVELSKALQLSLLERLALPYPASRVIGHPRQALDAARGLRFPLVVKPNVGGSGAGIVRFDTDQELGEAAESGGLNLGFDGTALVQEFVPAEKSRIVRVEVLDGRYLYAIRIYTEFETFDLCPGDICQTVDGDDLARAANPADAAKQKLRVEAYEPPAEIVEQVERIITEARIDVGGVEYMIDSRDGRHYFYDINALSNFVADAPRVIGFDPFVRLVDYLERKAG